MRRSAPISRSGRRAPAPILQELPVLPVSRSGCRPLSFRHGLCDQRAFSLVEMLVVCALVSTLSALGAAVYVEALKTARVTRAIGDLHALDVDIRQFHLRNNRYPTTLTEARPIVPNDPWGRPYVYTDLSGKGGKGKARKDGKLNPINSDFDLYSIGEDGKTTTPLRAPQSKDDVIRARDGAFLGLASEF